MEAADVSPPLSISNKISQEVTGTFLYYARAVDPTMLKALGYIAAQQYNPKEHMMQKVKQLLDYMATHPDAIITYHASDMVLAGHINALYLSEKKSKSRAGGQFFHVKKHGVPSQQWSSVEYSQNHQGSHVSSSRG